MYYNYRIFRARIVENAFGRLKERWRRVLKRNDMHTDNIPHVIAATCVCSTIYVKFTTSTSMMHGFTTVKVSMIGTSLSEPHTCEVVGEICVVTCL